MSLEDSFKFYKEVDDAIKLNDNLIELYYMNDNFELID